LLSKWMYPIIFNENFAESANVFNVYLLIIVSRLVFPQTILIGLRKSKVIMTASLIEIVVNVFFSVLFIKTIGVIGVAYATIVAYYLEKALLMLYLRYRMNIRPAEYTPVRWFLFYSALIFIAYSIVSFL